MRICIIHGLDWAVSPLFDWLVIQLLSPYLWLCNPFGLLFLAFEFFIFNFGTLKNRLMWWIWLYFSVANRWIWLYFSFRIGLFWDIVEKVILLALKENRWLLGVFLGCSLFFGTGFGWFFSWFLWVCRWFGLGVSGQCYGANFILLVLLLFHWHCLRQLFHVSRLVSW